MYSTFIEVRKKFRQTGCRLLTQAKEFSKTLNKVHYLAKCGHEADVQVSSFMKRGTGVYCPSCVYKIAGNKKRGDISRTQDGQSLQSSFEDESITYLHHVLHESFIVLKTHEGCLADIAIKPINIETDEWLGIQVKTTYKPNNTYEFKCNQRYKNLLVVCVCLEDKRIWMIPGDDITVKQKISIGLFRSKYDSYEVQKSDMIRTIHMYYNTICHQHFDDLDIPICVTQRLERKFRKLREECCSMLRFEYPTRSGMCFDFTIQDKKVQEKVGFYKNKNKDIIAFSLHKNNGKKDGIRKFKSYEIGDNDYYWLHFPCGKCFYFVPEDILVKHRFIDVGDEIYTRKHLYVTSNSSNKKWLSPYFIRYSSRHIHQRIQQVIMSSK